MDATTTHYLFWAFTTIQALGLVSAGLARFSVNRALQIPMQGLFFATLALVTASTLTSLALGWDAWVFSAGTLSIMVVLAIWDPGMRTAS